MHCSTLLAILVLVLLYLVLGALVFRGLEAPEERSQHLKLHSTRLTFLENHSCVSPDHLQLFLQVHNPESDPVLWILAQYSLQYTD